ncbi:MAG: type II toxin-antitoxin system RelE/ParE family toxin [Candidatus Micrarchaeota archaeon]|nr:type II toxin-antitoxin system RelE/ParE family toxin [Candidatus Micrarchaeota archaeon]
MASGTQSVSALFAVLLSNKAKKQLRQADPEIRSRAGKLFETLEREPVPANEYDVRKIEGRDETYRIRLSSFRIVYRVQWSEKTIWIAKTEKRSETTYD